MMAIKLVALLLLFMCLNVRGKTLDVSEHVTKIAESNIDISISLYKTLIEDKNVNNVMFSPISISVAMAMLHLGAKGDSASQIDEAFMFSKIEEGKFHSAFGELNGIMFDKVTDNVTIKSSNRVFSDQNLNVLSDYENALTVYGAQVDKLDFAQSDLALSAINEWVSTATNNTIPTLLDEIDPDTKMLVTNAVYFRGDWHSRFNEKLTEKRAFYISHYKVVETPFMFQRGKFRYGFIEELTLQILELPYAGKEFSMFILLPENFNLVAVEENLNRENLTKWISTMKPTSIDITLPKFKLEQTLKLENILPKLGVVDIFDNKKSNLQGISKATQLIVDEIIHKVAVEVSENGGNDEEEREEVLRSPSFTVVYADHPFIILVRGNHNNAFHLVGALKRPEGRLMSHDEL